MGDYISREAANDTINETAYEYEDDDKALTALYHAADRLNDLPAADVVERPRWIPVTERLPEDDGDYLVWYLIEDGADPCVGIFPYDSNVPAFGYWDEYYDPVTYGWAGSDFIKVRGITHWMPLPDPPKEAET